MSVTDEISMTNVILLSARLPVVVVSFNLWSWCLRLTPNSCKGLGIRRASFCGGFF